MAIDAVVEEVAENLEEAAAVTRKINTGAVGYFVGGVAFGTVLGFYFGYRFNREKIRAEAFAQSEQEVEKIREVYLQKAVAAEPKPTVEEVMEQRGYSTIIVEPDRPLKPPVPVSAPPVVTYEGGKSKDANWNYPMELARRSPEQPYIIHQDEFMNNESGYIHTNYSFYAGDGMLIDTDGDPVPNGDEVVGQGNLKFGHGTDDIDVVFVRNDKLGLEMEICRLPQSYEEEVLGLENNVDDET